VEPNDHATLQLKKKDTHPSRTLWSRSGYSHWVDTHPPQPCFHLTQAPQLCHVSLSSKLPAHPNPVSVRRAFGLSFVTQPRNPSVLWVNHRKPRKLGATSTKLLLDLAGTVVSTQCWFCGVNQQISCVDSGCEPLPCTGSMFMTSSYFSCHHAART
jgi:hypothetical protein